MAYGTLPLLPFALLLSLSPLSALAATSSLPKIDYNALGTVGVVGAFAGLQLYDPASPPTVYSSTASSLVSRSANGEFNSAGATNPGGRISALCQASSGAVFVGGLFTSLGGAPAANIAQYDPTTKAFTALGAGLDGEVLAMACNGTTVYAGGEFAAPVGAAAGAYAGHVAQWSSVSSSWSPPVFAGLNGPVGSIAPSEDGKSLFFGGSFSTAFSNTSSTSTSSSSPPDDDTFKSLGSSLVPISLNGSDYVASPTTYTSGFGNPQYVFCPRRGDGIGASWLLVDGTIGSFIARLYRPLQVRGIRLGNTFYEGRGTSNFSLTSIPDNTVLTLTYASDPTDASSPTTTCQANCPLAHDPDVPYQDFLFPDNHTMTGFELTILGFYGASAGLHLLQLLSEGSYAYAVDSYNYSPCLAGLGATKQSGVTTTGEWTQNNAVSSIPGTVQAVLTGQVPGGTAVADAPTLTWTPYVVSDGQYSIYYDTPGCQPANTCGKRTSVSVVVSPNGAAPTTTIIDQTNLLDKSTLIYTGPLVASDSPNGGLEVSVGLAEGGPALTSVTYGMVANIVSLVAASTNGSSVAQIDRGYGLFEYPVDGAGTFGDAVAAASNLNAASSTLTNATAINQLSFGLAAGALVNAIVSVGEGTATRVFLGGNFVYTRETSTSTNVVAYSDNATVLAPNGGLAGPVTSLVELDGVLYAAGAFVATSDGSVRDLDGAAMWVYETAGSVWQSLGTVPKVGGSITALGVANTGTDVSVVAAGAGLAIFNPATKDWNSTEAGLVVGNLTAFGGATSSSNRTGTTYFAGNILTAMSFVAPGGALLSTNNDRSPKLTSLGYQLESALSSSPSSPAANITTPSRSRRMAARSMVKDVLGMLSARSTLEPRAPSMMNATLPSALPSDSTAQVLAGAFWKNGSDTLMVVGGRFVTSGGIANVGLYDQEARTLEALPGTVIAGAVSVLAVFKDTLWIGGNFSTAAGRHGLSTYDLSKLAVNDSSPALQGYTGANATVNIIRQRPGFDSTIIVAGSFGAAGSLTCQSICAWDTTTRQWSSFGGGLQGVVGAVDFAGSKSEHLVAAGAFTLAGETSYVAQWNFKNQTWASLGSPTDVPGPATALSTDSNDESKIWLAGASTTDVPYLLFWNGTTWADVNDGVLASGSGVQQLVFVPLSTNHRTDALIEKNRMLLVSGDLTINSTSVSSALFDGENWYPYLVSSTATGSAGVISQLFYSITNFSLSKDYLSVGIVILISIAIALGLVFLLVIIGLLIALSRRHDEPAYPVQPRDDTDSLHAQHRPTSLLATVGAATAVLLDGKSEKGAKGGREPTEHDSVAGPLSFDGGLSYDEHHYDEDSAARVRYSFTAEQDAELSVSAGEDLTILESNDANWWLVSNNKGVRGLIPASYLA